MPVSAFNEQHFDTSPPPLEKRVTSKRECTAKTTDLALIYTPEASSPFRIARIMTRTSTTNPEITVHWHGNKEHLPVESIGTFKCRPSWYQNTDKRNYYLEGRLSSTHSPYTSLITGECLHESNIICQDLKLTKGWHLTSDSARRCLVSIDQCIQDYDGDGDVTKFQIL